MVNGINSQRNNDIKTDVIQSTLEMTEDVWSIMMEAVKKGKQVRLEATEDTSYKNINHMEKLGLIHVLEDNEREWSSRKNGEDEYKDDDCDTIIMHDMLVEVDEVKLQDELNKLREKIAKRTEKNIYTRHSER